MAKRAELSIAFEDFISQLGVKLTLENRDLYLQALVHGSYTYEYKLSALENYERLEFLGDAVLKLFVSEYLFQTYGYYREGELTKIRAVLVSDQMLAVFCQELGLDEHMILGPAEEKNKGRKKTSNLACALEAFLGALYIDNQWNTISHCLTWLLEKYVDDIEQSKTKDNFKAALQEWCQGKSLGLPHYQTVLESGPAHQKTFVIDVSISSEVHGQGKGMSKKEAQQQAAKAALIALGQEIT